MSDFPEGVAAPDGAQKLVDVCKEAWAVIQDESSDVQTNGSAAGRYEIAVGELNKLGVHVNNEGGLPVFTLGVKETAYDPSARVAGAPFLGRRSAVGVPALTNLVDLRGFGIFCVH
jgi:hypothetical protein